MPPNLSRFTKRALRALALSEEEVRRLRHRELGTDHILLGLVAEGIDATSQFLRAKGVSLAAARNEAAKLSKDNRSPSEAVLTLTPITQPGCQVCKATNMRSAYKIIV